MNASHAAAEPLPVGQVSSRFGVTVRTLHHYDEVGLLRPSERTASGYRLYTATDLTRLAHIVTYRRLGFSLDRIADLLDADPDGVASHLRRQRELVSSRLDELHALQPDGWRIVQARWHGRCELVPMQAVSRGHIRCPDTGASRPAAMQRGRHANARPIDPVQCIVRFTARVSERVRSTCLIA